MYIGIDFGTRFSCVSIMNGKIPITDLIDDPNKTGIPTLFMYSQSKKTELYGYQCLSVEAVEHRDDVIQNMKKLIRENPKNLNTTVMSGGKSYTIHDVIKKYLMYLIAQAKNAAEKSGEFTNTNFEAVTITAPIGIASGTMTATDYNNLLRDTIMQITGLPKDKVYVLEEPVSAAISYLYRENINENYDDKQTILVFDLGAGTLDVTIVEYNPVSDGYCIKAKEGDLALGGNDWDDALANAVLKKLKISNTFKSAIEKLNFQNNIIRLKHDLTTSENCDFCVRCNGGLKSGEFTRNEFEIATKALLDRAIDVTKKAIKSFNGGLASIDKIILVGGSSNMPQIYNRMVREFPTLGKDKIITHDPSKAIAKGAAIYAKQDKIIIDAASHTYGFYTINSALNKEMVYNVLFKGTTFDSTGVISVKTDGSFSALEDSQKIILFTVVESNAEKGVGEDANFMDRGLNENQNGMAVTINIPEKFLGKAKEYKCWVTFILYQKTGILEIIITDANGNKIGYDKKQV